jgi:small subunit ribosomal protein S16
LTHTGDFPKLRACLAALAHDHGRWAEATEPSAKNELHELKLKEVAKNMVKIRMMRMGSKKRPFYRVMAIDERKQRDGRPLEFLGTYDPRIEPPAVKLNLEGIDGWIGKGAQLSGTVRSLVNGVRRTGSGAETAAAGASNNNV